MRIMTVDDSKAVREVIQNAADVLGFECIHAEDGREAMAKLDEYDGNIDLVLLDWNMPIMDGMETLESIKSHGRHKSIPVTMVTTESEREKVVAAIRAGAKNYVMKPFSQEELVNKIMESLGMGV